VANPVPKELREAPTPLLEQLGDLGDFFMDVIEKLPIPRRK